MNKRLDEKGCGRALDALLRAAIVFFILGLLNAPTWASVGFALVTFITVVWSKHDR